MTLDELNSTNAQSATQWFSQTCAAQTWVNEMVAARPYSTLDALISTAETIWQQMQEDDLLEAFSAHPMIGDVNSLKKKFASTKAMASNEQSGTAEASEQVLQALNAINHQYLDRNGFIFIICATGLSAQTMLDALKSRIDNDRETELKIAAEQQIKITLLRINKGLQNE